MKEQFKRERELLSAAMRPAEKPQQDVPWQRTIRKTQGVEVTDMSGETVLAMVEGEEAAIDFLRSLSVEEWVLAPPPRSAVPQTCYALCAIDVIQWAAEDCFTTVSRLASITRYVGRNIVSLEKGSLLVSYEVPEGTLRYLDQWESGGWSAREACS